MRQCHRLAAIILASLLAVTPAAPGGPTTRPAINTLISFGGPDHLALGKEVLGPGVGVVQTWSPKWMSHLEHATHAGLAVLVDEQDAHAFPRVLIATRPGYLAKSRASATDKQLAAYAAEVRRQCRLARSGDPTRVVILYMRPLCGPIQYAEHPQIGAWAADNARLAKARPYVDADAIGVSCYLHVDDAAWMSPGAAHAYTRDSLRGAEVYGGRRVAVLCPEFIYGGAIPEPILRAQVDACRDVGVDVLWWMPAKPTDVARGYAALCRRVAG